MCRYLHLKGRAAPIILLGGIFEWAVHKYIVLKNELSRRKITIEKCNLVTISMHIFTNIYVYIFIYTNTHKLILGK